MTGLSESGLSESGLPEPGPPEPGLWVQAAGLLTTVQDLGRFGGLRYGISVCGALEGDHLRLVGAAVGNAVDAAALELSGGPVRLELWQPTWACWLGQGPSSLESGRPERVTHFETTGRGILALAGGIAVPKVQGSRATDLRAGFGGLEGRALRRGDFLRLGPPPPDPVSTSPRWRLSPLRLEGAVRVVRGPEWNLLSLETQRNLEQIIFRVSAQSNRMGLRLESQLLETHFPGEMRSSAVLPGTVQLPPGGRLIVLLQDAGTVGGYPRILSVAAVDLPRLAVMAVGSEFRVQLISSEAAVLALLEREKELRTLLWSIALRRSQGTG